MFLSTFLGVDIGDIGDLGEQQSEELRVAKSSFPSPFPTDLQPLALTWTRHVLCEF